MSPRTDRLSSIARDRSKRLAAAGAERMASTLRGHTKPVVYAGAALALAGIGTATAAGAASASTVTPKTTTARTAAHAQAASQPTATAAPAALPSIAALTSGKHALPITPQLPAGTPSQPQVVTWQQVQQTINQQTNPAAAKLGQTPAADQLTPVAATGQQTWMPISPAQLSNATAIVQQALDKKMGIRSAVVAVATAMQESQLLNLNYGDQDSLGLFQQRPSMGWGTAAQLTDPSYAANAFLTALQQYQAGDPSWASQPLWASAQAVQKSGVPLAYAQWESQAAGLVKQIAMQLK